MGTLFMLYRYRKVANMKNFFQNPKFKNPYFYLSTIALIFSASGVDFNELTSWVLLGQSLLGILSNPVSVLAVVTAFLGVWNDNSTKGLDKPTQKKR